MTLRLVRLLQRYALNPPVPRRTPVGDGREGHPGRRLNATVVRAMGTDLVTVRIDLDRLES